MTMTGIFDSLLPFQIEKGAVRGRLVRLEEALDQMLGGRNFPPIICEKLAETAALAVALAGALKYDGLFTLQIQGDGAIPLLVVDVSSNGDIRGTQRHDEEKLKAILEAGTAHDTVNALFGKGYLVFTIDQGENTERYQGIVELAGTTLADCVCDYLRQSEQLPSMVATASKRAKEAASGWRSAALVIQRMPLSLQSPIVTRDEAEEDWNRATILTRSVQSDELLDPALSGVDLLNRLYHAEGLALYAAKPLQGRCRCSSDRIRGSLISLSADDLHEIEDDKGFVTVTCDFCNNHYMFRTSDLLEKEV